MKKIALISSLVMLLLACSMSDVSNLLAPTPTPRPLPSATNTLYLSPTNTPTITETLPTPTFTGTPTLMGGGFTTTPTWTVPPTMTAIPTSSGSAITSTIAPGSLQTTQYVGFTLIRISGSVIKWGGCEPSSVTISAHVSNPSVETGVLLFVRLSSPTTGELSKWEAGASMVSDKNGNFTYTLKPRNISHITEYPNGWLQYQLKAIDVHLKIVGYTQPYTNNIVVSKCTKADFATPSTSTSTPLPPTATLQE